MQDVVIAVTETDAAFFIPAVSAYIDCLPIKVTEHNNNAATNIIPMETLTTRIYPICLIGFVDDSAEGLPAQHIIVIIR